MQLQLCRNFRARCDGTLACEDKCREKCSQRKRRSSHKKRRCSPRRRRSSHRRHSHHTSSSAVVEFADFFALMPGDNSATIAVGAPVLFPQSGSTHGHITRVSAGVFKLADIGTYKVSFQVSVSEAGQLMLELNSALLPDTVVGRATGTSQLVGVSIVTTTVINSTLSVINPPGNSTALTVTPVAGGTHSVSAHLVIERLL